MMVQLVEVEAHLDVVGAVGLVPAAAVRRRTI